MAMRPVPSGLIVSDGRPFAGRGGAGFGMPAPIWFLFINKQ
jgi:hypothetical protein